MSDFLNGATAIGCLIAAMFFFRFYRQSLDRLFLFFGFSFSIFAVNRVLLSLLEDGHEGRTFVYLSRLGGFLLILFAIIDKNKSAER